MVSCSVGYTVAYSVGRIAGYLLEHTVLWNMMGSIEYPRDLLSNLCGLV